MVYDVTYKTPDISPVVSSVKSALKIVCLMSCVGYSSNMLKSLQLVKERWRVTNHDLRSMYPFLIKFWNYVVEMPVFSVIKPGVAVFFPFLYFGTNEPSRADYKTEVKMIKTGKGIKEASLQMIHSPSDDDYYLLSSLMTSRRNYSQLASRIAKFCLPSRKRNVKKKVSPLMASFILGIIDTMTANTLRNLCLWMI